MLGGKGMNTYDVVIVGSGPAGMTAAIYAARANLKVLMIDKLAPGGQIINTQEIGNYTGIPSINGAELAIQMYQHTQDLHVEFLSKEVKNIKDDGNYKIVYLEDDELLCKTVIIATGTKPRKLNVEGEVNFAGNGISWCAICDGAQYQGKDVVVIGGGNSAVEESLYLSEIADSVTIITLFDLTADAIACDRLKARNNVKVYPYQENIKFYGDTRLERVTCCDKNTKEMRSFKADGVFEYIGLEPTTNNFSDLGILNEAGYVETDAFMHTKIPGIYAAGDCINKRLRQVITACADGAMAAQEASRYVKEKFYE